MSTFNKSVGLIQKSGLDLRRSRNLVLIAIILISCIPLLSKVTYWSYDLEFHLFRIQGIADGLRHGQFPVRMQYSQAGGYGYPVSIMYGDWILYIPALMHIAGLSLTLSYRFALILLNAASVVLTYYVFRRVFQSGWIGICGAVLWNLSLYRITDIYKRAAVGEYVAMAFFPMVFFGLWSCLQPDRKGASRQGWIWCALGLTGIVTSHIISTFMLVLVMIPILLYALVFRSSVYIWVQFIKTIFLTLGLSLSFLVPFISYSRSANLAVYALPTDLKIKRMADYSIEPGRFLELFGAMFRLNAEAPPSLGGVSIAVGWAVLAGIFIWAVVCLCSKSRAEDNYLIDRAKKWETVPVLLSALIALFLASSLVPWHSKPLEKIINVVSDVQFPSRFISLAVFFMIILGLSGLSMLYDQSDLRVVGRKAIVGITLLACLEGGYALGFYMENADKFTPHSNQETTIVDESIMNGEYLPNGTNVSEVYPNKVVNHEPDVKRAELKNFSLDQGHATGSVRTQAESGEVILPLFSYPNYAIDCQPSTSCSLTSTGGGTNFLVARFPANFDGKFVLNYRIPMSWRIADVVSLAAWIMLTACICIRKFRDFPVSEGIRIRHRR